VVPQRKRQQFGNLRRIVDEQDAVQPNSNSCRQPAAAASCLPQALDP
jgi:hypothetical protein